MIISQSDTLYRLLGKIESTAEYKSMATWKFAVLKSSKNPTFIKCESSEYLLATSHIDEASVIDAIWDIKNGTGCLCFNTVVGLKGLLFTAVPPIQLSIYNTIIFDKHVSPSKALEEKAFEILCRLVTSKEHCNKGHKELAIKSLQMASEFRTNFNDLMSLLTTLEESSAS